MGETELLPALPAGEDDGLLRGFWYPAVQSSRIRGRQLSAAELLGIPLAVGRDAAGRAFALEDFCPHRGMPLSKGWFDGQRVECCYHGWQFDPHSGQCTAVPSLTARDKLRVDRIFARHFPTEERDGYVWVYIPDPAAPDAAPPPAPELPKFSDHYKLVRLEAGMPCHVDHGIIGLMDPAHGPFVHQSWWWRRRHSIHEKEKTFEAIPHGFRIVPHQPSANSAPYKLLRLYGHPITTTIEFVLPNMRFEQIRCGPYWFSSRATVTPVRKDFSRIDFVAAWNLFRWVPGVTAIFRFFAQRFIEQDRRTMEMQSVGLKRNPKLMLIDDADRPAKWYFQLKARLVEMRRTGADLPHPVPGRVTLRWRS
jgi:phenylpropionate dioxygenase-like ring-hydroxylating dioxygenase large terminal subunit